ncbi:MAG: DUF3458 domain-containing protein, partial [Pseudomonadota bacterium]
EAATCEDFIKAIEEANGIDLAQFRRWYHQAGTPTVTASGTYDPEGQRYSLTLTQHHGSQKTSDPLMIPVRMGLITQAGETMTLKPEGEADTAVEEGVLCLTETTHTFTFTDINSPPIPSLFRGFSAPIKLKLDLADDALAVLASHDPDHFNRWEAKQTLATRVMLAAIERDDATIPDTLTGLFAATLEADDLPNRFRSLMLQLPSEQYLAQQLEVIDPDLIHRIRKAFVEGLAARFTDQWQQLYERLAKDAAPTPNAQQIGRRSLRNTVLGYLCAAPDQPGVALAAAQYDQADNMTDRIAALGQLVDAPEEAHANHAAKALQDFYTRWENEALVIDKWFMIQARSSHPDTRSRVQALTKHPAFTLTNPNRLRSLIGVFAAGNQRHFHSADGQGYQLLIDTVIALNSLNPQTAARLLSPMRQWRRFEPTRRDAMAAQLRRLLAQPDLSRDVFEVATKSLEK